MLGALALLAACADDETRTRIDALETKVQQLSQEFDSRAPARDAERASANAKEAATFDIVCPPPWQALGPAGDAVWTCRADRPAANGMWPNCNVTVGQAEPDARPKEILEGELAAIPQLRAARRLSARDTTLASLRAYEAIYEHDLLPTPLRVLATISLLSDRAYGISCSAPPETFAVAEPIFRRITASFRFK
jgi:hypothetical protein